MMSLAVLYSIPSPGPGRYKFKSAYDLSFIGLNFTHIDTSNEQ